MENETDNESIELESEDEEYEEFADDEGSREVVVPGEMLTEDTNLFTRKGNNIQ
jgi:hypothetical protein